MPDGFSDLCTVCAALPSDCACPRQWADHPLVLGSEVTVATDEEPLGDIVVVGSVSTIEPDKPPATKDPLLSSTACDSDAEQKGDSDTRYVLLCA